MGNTIDDLMERLGAKLGAEYERVIDNDPTLNGPGDIDILIAYHRRNRANAEAGIKPVKEKAAKGAIPASILDSLMVKKPAGEPIKRRV